MLGERLAHFHRAINVDGHDPFEQIEIKAAVLLFFQITQHRRIVDQ